MPAAICAPRDSMRRAVVAAAWRNLGQARAWPPLIKFARSALGRNKGAAGQLHMGKLCRRLLAARPMSTA